ncbi:hypothetical protein [Deinococcus cellulosilyticus]|uniref:Uncharacterized protein n=1 Tax=Deinococcus cellulosilyticus (strain DSM 18568 / NBRC 106333 / KACC 11606 / 5516J-15) TaxID=1223518 RepID=A0A511N8U6_DEIC1|nr:hypothetical protein [Deinococcus cellulosilyticus]GEM49232.1 hypothetical protein DC3_48670 [Deinococcus cellulosilyticus NBRC 106333 = KACC 11606]
MTLKHAVEQLLISAQDENSTPDDLYPLAQCVFDEARKQPRTAVEEALRDLASGLSLSHAGKAGLIGMCIGAFLEGGCSPKDVQDALLDRLEEVLHRAEEHLSGCTDPENLSEECLAALDDLELFWRPAIALLSVSPAARSEAAPLLPLLEPLSEHHEGAHWLSKLIPVMHEEPVVVLEPSTGLGIEGLLSGVVDNFQLHVLLMDVFPQKGLFKRKRTSERIIAVARGDGPQEGEDHVEGCWNMYTHEALLGDLTLSEASENWVWGEGTPSDIPVLEDRRVILLGPPTYHRTWNSMRMFSALKADLKVTRVLNERQVRSWLERITNREE